MWAEGGGQGSGREILGQNRVFWVNRRVLEWKLSIWGRLEMKDSGSQILENWIFWVKVLISDRMRVG